MEDEKTKQADDEYVECPDCNGTGDVIDERRIHSRIIDIPYKKCTTCGGTGKVEAE